MGSLADVNSDGEICYDEFVAMMFPAAASALAKFRKHHRTLKNAKHAFDSYDVDGDGEITYEELVGGMGGDYSANEISAIFAMGDTDQDGKISFLEFSKIMIPSCQDTLTKFWKCFRNVQGVRETFKKFDADGDAQISSLREESLKEREEVRAHVRSQVMSRASVAKECYEAHHQPWEAEQLEEESMKKASTELSAEERIEQLRRTTEEMLTSRTEYVVSTRSLALQAMREDAEEVAASRTVRRTAVVAAA